MSNVAVLSARDEAIQAVIEQIKAQYTGERAIQNATSTIEVKRALMALWNRLNRDLARHNVSRGRYDQDVEVLCDLNARLERAANIGSVMG